MTNFEISLPSGDLASRNSAAAIRRTIECALTDGAQRIIVDLSLVKSLSESYADELFGVLLTRIGIEQFVRSFLFCSADKNLVLDIAGALRNRIKDSEHARVSELLSSLVARRHQNSGVAFHR